MSEPSKEAQEFAEEIPRLLVEANAECLNFYHRKYQDKLAALFDSHLSRAVAEAVEGEREREACAKVADARYKRMTERADGDAAACDAEACDPVRLLTRDFWERISTARAREALKCAEAIRLRGKV